MVPVPKRLIQKNIYITIMTKAVILQIDALNSLKEMSKDSTGWQVPCALENVRYGLDCLEGGQLEFLFFL